MEDCLGCVALDLSLFGLFLGMVYVHAFRGNDVRYVMVNGICSL